MGTKIEWTEETWNPIIGCSKISEGCQNCYAEKMATRLAAMSIKNVKPELDGYPTVILGRKWSGETYFRENQLEKPLKRKKPTTYFVCSMGDLFHASVPFGWVLSVLKIISKCPQHTFIILTKRADRMNEFFSIYSQVLFNKPHLNVWLGVSAENQEQANKRIPALLDIPGYLRFVSIEPMLGAINLTLGDMHEGFQNSLKGEVFCPGMNEPTTCNKIDWVICGGESGPNARPLHPDWVYSLIEQCEENQTPFFFKQWGEFYEGRRVGKKAAGSAINGIECKEYPIIKK